MRSTIVKNELVVGIFVAVAMILGLLYVTKQTREKGFLDVRHLEFTVAHGSGLETGAPVLMQGIEVGSIDDIQLTEDNKVKITCSIRPAFADHVSQDSLAAVVEPPLLGSTKVEIRPGVSKNAAKSGAELKVFTSENLFDRIEGMEGRIDGVIAKVDSFVDTANTTLKSVQNITKAIEESRGLAGRLVNDPKLAEDVQSLVEDLKDVAKEIKDGDGVIAMAISDKEFADDMKSTMGDVRSIADDIQEGKGSLGRLYKDSKLIDETEGMITDVRGSLKKLDELNVQAQASITKVQTLLDRTVSTMGKVDTVLSSSGEITTQLAKTLEKINEGEGTIAALLNDDSLYKETKSLLKELRESVEDLREQAPINSFIGVVFSAF